MAVNFPYSLAKRTCTRLFFCLGPVRDYRSVTLSACADQKKKTTADIFSGRTESARFLTECDVTTIHLFPNTFSYWQSRTNAMLSDWRPCTYYLAERMEPARPGNRSLCFSSFDVCFDAGKYHRHDKQQYPVSQENFHRDMQSDFCRTFWIVAWKCTAIFVVDWEKALPESAD